MEETLDKVLLITGGSRGIGAATALLAARRGFAVAVNYASNSRAADEVVMALVAGLSAIGLGQFDAIALDLVDRTDMNAVGADYFHMFADCRKIAHFLAPCLI